MSEPFIAAFVFALLSEIVDKTQLLILALALKYRSPFKVFSGALFAHALMDGLAVLLGMFFAFSLPEGIINKFVGLLFVLMGGWTFAKIYSRREERNKKIKGRNPFVVSFLTILIGEVGDKTQITSGLLTAKYLKGVAVFLGIVLALAVAIGLNVFIGSRFAERMPKKVINILTAVLFVLFGLFSLLS